MDAESKSAKKNKKRNKKKKLGAEATAIKGGTSSPAYLLAALKEKLIEVKASEEPDHKLAGKLRDQIWVLTDIVAGVRTDLPDDELRPILESISAQPIMMKDAAKTAADTAKEKPSISGVDRKLQQLQKKLAKIDELKAKKANGDKLEKNQLEKIETEKAVKDEIEELEDMLANAHLLT